MSWLGEPSAPWMVTVGRDMLDAVVSCRLSRICGSQSSKFEMQFGAGPSACAAKTCDQPECLRPDLCDISTSLHLLTQILARTMTSTRICQRSSPDIICATGVLAETDTECDVSHAPLRSSGHPDIRSLAVVLCVHTATVIQIQHRALRRAATTAVCETLRCSCTSCTAQYFYSDSISSRRVCCCHSGVRRLNGKTEGEIHLWWREGWWKGVAPLAYTALSPANSLIHYRHHLALARQRVYDSRACTLRTSRSSLPIHPNSICVP